jgi:ribonuclease P/MRP protein subunit POP5
MVRIKHRYLLLYILYPSDPPSERSRTATDEVPDLIKFHRPTPDDFDSAALRRLITNHVSQIFGEYGVGAVNGRLQGLCAASRSNEYNLHGRVVKYLSTATSTAIIRVSRDHWQMVAAALCYVTQLPKPFNLPCVVQVVCVSGTIRKSEEEAIRRARQAVRRASMAAGPGTQSFIDSILSQSISEPQAVEESDSEAVSMGE